MKPLLYLLCVLSAISSTAQTIYLADTAFVTDVGFGGAPTSCKTNGLVYNGVGMDRLQGQWVADVFSVPAGATWTFDTVVVYGYQFGSGLSSPFPACNLQIYSGTPGAGGSVIWGDTVTNVLNSAKFTGIYKVDTFASNGGLMSAKRPIMALKLHLSPAPTLGPGSYWLAWSVTGTSSINPPVCPYKVLPGRFNPPAQMARWGSGNTWSFVSDNGQYIGFCKMILAKPGLSVETIGKSGAGILQQNKPNPCRGTTTIKYSVATHGYVKLMVCDVLGREVARLVDAERHYGEHEVIFDTTPLPAGTYYYRLSTEAGDDVRHLVVVK